MSWWRRFRDWLLEAIGLWLLRDERPENYCEECGVRKGFIHDPDCSLAGADE